MVADIARRRSVFGSESHMPFWQVRLPITKSGLTDTPVRHIFPADLADWQTHIFEVKERMEMLDYRMHYAVMATQDRLRTHRQPEITRDRGMRRVFRLVGGRSAGRSASGR
jgi:hypothetical protein